MALPKLESTDALIVVDVQRDFCPGGTLAVAGADQIIPVLNRWIEAARKRGAKIIMTRDWHPRGHVSFRERSGPWPAHCIQQTPGAQFHEKLTVPNEAQIVNKGVQADSDAYSAFQETQLATDLRRHSIRRLWVGGLAQDVCVRATVLDGIQAGFEVHLIKAATCPVNVVPGDGERSLREMRDAGCIIEEENE